MRLISVLMTVCLCLTVRSTAYAQNTGGVFGPVVNKGHRAAQYRVTSDPDNDLLAQRIHVEDTPTDDLMWRLVAQIRRSSVGTTEFDYVQGEVFWQITPNEARWQHGLRFDWRVRGGDRPGVIGLNYMNQVDLLENLELRSVLLTAIEFGDDRRDGVLLETRNHLAYRVQPGVRVGVESFNVYGSTAGFRNFKRQRHQLGPFATVDIDQKWSVFIGGLFGLSEASPDPNARFWLTRVF